MCATYDEFPRDTSSTSISTKATATASAANQPSHIVETRQQQKIVEIGGEEEKPILRQPSNYNEYKHNRVSSIVDMTIDDERRNESAENHFEDGTCFFLVADRPLTTKVVATLVENGASKSVVTTVSNLNVPFPLITKTSSRVYGIPIHDDCTRCGDSPTTEIHVSTKECSISSGVGSGESSELDSPVPRTSNTNNRPMIYTRSLLTSKKQQQLQQPPSLYSVMENNKGRKTKSQSTQTDKSMHSSNTSMRLHKPRSSLNSSLNSSRRDSGFSSPSSPNFVNDSSKSFLKTTTATKPCLHCAGRSSRGRTHHNINYEKEALLANIKRHMYDPEKEIYMQEIKQFLRNTGQQTFAKQSSSSPWRPIKQLHSAPLRGVLKYNPSKLLEEIQTRHNMKALERARKERSMLCPLKRSEVVDIIKQVQKCLAITQQQKSRTNPPLQCKFQIHRKIKLKSFQYSEENNVSCARIGNKNSKDVARRASLGYSMHLDYFSKQLQQAASCGDIKRILEVINSNPTVLEDTQGRGLPAFHYAFKKQHYRTAMLLFEAGTNLEVYTEQRVQEYQQMMEIIGRNKKLLSY